MAHRRTQGPSVVEGTPVNRMTRQRQRTHDRLVDAALSVMARKGADLTTIQDITETADVGFGSFYNHFSSKEEIMNEAIDALFERIGAQIDAETATISDPLEVVAAGIRIFINIILVKRDWWQFILRVSMVPEFKKVGLFPRLFRDVKAAEAAGRLSIADSEAAIYAVAGALVFLSRALLEGDLPKTDASTRIAAMALRALGVGEDDVTDLMSRPLPGRPKTALAAGGTRKSAS